MVSRIPLGGGSSSGNYSILGRPPLDDEHQAYAERRVVSEGYFAAMQIPIVRGRAFADAERAPQIVINEALARKSFPGEDPVGKMIAQGSDPGHDAATVVGVAADVKQQRLNTESAPEIYYPQSQVGQSEMDLVLRTDGDPMALLPAVKAQVALLDPSQPVTRVRTIEHCDWRVEESRYEFDPELARRIIDQEQYVGLTMSGLARRAFLPQIAQDTSGPVRRLDARFDCELRMVLGEGLRLSAVGVLAGILAALALARLLAGFLYGVSPRDPLTYLVVAAGLIAAAAAATFLPARRATRVDPAVALRAE